MTNTALLLSLNDEFVPCAKIFLHSLLKNNPTFSQDVILLADSTLSNDGIQELKAVYSNLKKIYVQVDDYKNCKQLTKKWKVNLLYRFDIFELGNLGYDKIILVDADMIVTGKIDSLLEQNVLFGACRKNPLKDKDIFNCGLMVFSKDILQRAHKNELIKLACGGEWESDQPLFNQYMKQYVTFLPQKYNVTSEVLTEELAKEGVIFHFAGQTKPYGLKKKVENSFNKDFIKEKGITLLSSVFYKLKIFERELNKLYV